MTAVVSLFFEVAFGIAAVFVTATISSAFLHILPSAMEIAVGKVLIEMASHLLPPSISIAKVSSIFWYGRGNVLYQIGQMRDEKDLATQNRLAEVALCRLSIALKS